MTHLFPSQQNIVQIIVWGELYFIFITEFPNQCALTIEEEKSTSFVATAVNSNP